MDSFGGGGGMAGGTQGGGRFLTLWLAAVGLGLLALFGGAAAGSG